MSQPGRLLSLFTTVITSPTPAEGSITGSSEVDTVLKTLPGTDLVRLLKHVRDWNANARTSPIAQVILHAILKLRSPEDIINAFERHNRSQQKKEDDVDEEMDGDAEKDKDKDEAGADEKKSKRGKNDAPISLKDLLGGLIPYSERHFNRIDKLVQESYMLDYVVGEMDGGLFGGEVMDIDGEGDDQQSGAITSIA
jgi:U3 small nucleolar RNA-associated protein 13